MELLESLSPNRSLGKRGRSNPVSKEETYGSEKSYEKYYKKHGNSMQMAPKNQQESSDPNLNKGWIKENLKQNKEYEKVNNLSSKAGEWDTVFKKANARGIKTSKLENIARQTDNPHEMKEYGFKPQVKNIMKTYDDLKQKGFLPNVKITGFDAKMTKSGVYGAYNTKSGEYILNMNSLSIARINKAMKSNQLAGKSFNDVIAHELGHGVYFQNMVKSVTVKQGVKKSRVPFTAKQKAVRSAYAKLQNELRKNLRQTGMQGLSGYVTNHARGSKAKARIDKATGQRIALTKQDRAKHRNSAYVEGFAEGYVNYVRHRMYGETLHPIGRTVGNFLKEINKYQ